MKRELLALPWVVRTDSGGVFINDSNGHTVCGMPSLEVLPADRDLTFAEYIVHCVNAAGATADAPKVAQTLRNEATDKYR